MEKVVFFGIVKDFYRKITPFLVFLPVLVIELVVLNKSVRKFYSLNYSNSPDKKILSEIQEKSNNVVLGQQTTSQKSSIREFFSNKDSWFPPSLIGNILIIVIVFLFLVLGIFFLV